jgi:hypothetical protein
VSRLTFTCSPSVHYHNNATIYKQTSIAISPASENFATLPTHTNLPSPCHHIPRPYTRIRTNYQHQHNLDTLESSCQATKARRLVLVGQTRSVYIFLTPSLRTKRLTRKKKQPTYLFALIENSNVKFDYNVRSQCPHFPSFAHPTILPFLHKIHRQLT